MCTSLVGCQYKGGSSRRDNVEHNNIGYLYGIIYLVIKSTIFLVTV